MKIFAPTENDSSQLFACVMDSFRLFGLEFSAIVKSKLEPIYGESWIIDLSKERNTKITLQDTSFLLKEILRNPSTPLRLCIPKHKDIFLQIERVLNERNKWFHNEVILNIHNAISAISVIESLARSISLDLRVDLLELVELLKKIEKGEGVSSEAKEDLKEKIDSSQVSLLALQVESNEIQNRLSKTEERVEQLKFELNLSNKNIDHKDSLIQLMTSEKNLLQEQLRDLKESLVLNELEKNALRSLMENFEEIRTAKNTKPEFQDMEFEIGDIWPYQKGETKLTLSSRFKDIYLSDSSTFLSDIIGNSSKVLAASWLKLKPTGGQIWLDGYGNFTTYFGEKLCYLGRISISDVNKVSNNV